MLEHSPLGKVPYLQTEEGDLCESQCIVEYLAARFPDKADFLRRSMGGGQGARD